MFIGIDLGTSGVKTVLCDERQRVVAQASAPLEVSRPQPGWAEQAPADWWQATNAAMAALKRDQPKAMGAVRGIGLAGQMHGATLLDRADKVLRPAILWNDGRSAAECAELEQREPRVRRITGTMAMPGFTAPKLMWLAKAEPKLFARVARVLLPKDYLRLLMTGDHASDVSDSSGTLWLDVGRRAWSKVMLAATGLDEAAMPRLYEGNQPTGTVRAKVAAAWGLPAGVPVAAGGGDNAGGAVGAGVIAPGQALLSLGTSGVLFVAEDGFRPHAAQAVHTFCHCLPGMWHKMSVMLTAAAAITWLAEVTGAPSPAALLAEAGYADRDVGPLLFLPYLAGERTPHNDPNAMGVFYGLTYQTSRADLTRAVLEGVAFAIADGQAALIAAGATIDAVSVIGGGGRSPFWARILAAALARPLTYRQGGELGPAFGAARLARLAVTGEQAAAVCTRPPIDQVVEPDRRLTEHYAARHERFGQLYPALKPLFARERRAGSA